MPLMRSKTVIAYSFLFLTLFTYSCNQRNFDPEKWRADEKSQYYMLDDIYKRSLLIGSSKDNLIELLGTDNIKSFNKETNVWMFIISKPFPTYVSDTPVEIMDVFFRADTVFKVEIRSRN